MNLRRNKWTSINLSECCDFQRGVVFSTKDEVDSGGFAILRSHNVDFENSKITLHNLRHIKENVKVNNSQRLQKNDILISVANSKEQTGKIGFSYEDTDTYAGGFMAILRPRKIIEPFYLFVYLLTNSSKNYIAERTQGTTNIFNITFERIKKLPLPFPLIEEQKQIAALFQSIEDAIKKMERQEKNLNLLQKTLSNGLVSKSPVLGNLLSGKNCNLCLFENITDCIEKHDKKPLASGITHFVGLEFIEADNFNLQGVGNIEEKGTTFTKRFSKGDVLFGKRRAYLKKVAVADFDGICSGDILVFRANKAKMLPELLPYYISSDAFIQQAVSTSAGSLSPRTKWRDLAALEVSIPDLKTQEKIVEIFRQLRITQELLKQQKNTLKNLKQKLLSEILG